jgi:hypothetical protein
MDTNSDRLRLVLLTVLQSQSPECKSLRSQLDAALFTLHYAKGAALGKERQFETVEQKLQYFRLLLEESRRAADASDPLVLSLAGMADSVQRSINNSAVAAPDVLAVAQALTGLNRIFADVVRHPSSSKRSAI